MCLNFLNLNETVGLYFFSAVFQGNMALCALTSVFVIYKLQQINTQLQSNENRIIDYIKGAFNSEYVTGVGFLSPPIINFADIRNIEATLIDERKKVSDGNHHAKIFDNLIKDPYLTETLNKIKELDNKTIRIKADYRSSLLLVISVILISLIFLPLIYHIHVMSQIIFM